MPRYSWKTTGRNPCLTGWRWRRGMAVELMMRVCLRNYYLHTTSHYGDAQSSRADSVHNQLIFLRSKARLNFDGQTIRCSRIQFARRILYCCTRLHTAAAPALLETRSRGLLLILMREQHTCTQRSVTIQATERSTRNHSSWH